MGRGPNKEAAEKLSFDVYLKYNFMEFTKGMV